MGLIRDIKYRNLIKKSLKNAKNATEKSDRKFYEKNKEFIEKLSAQDLLDNDSGEIKKKKIIDNKKQKFEKKRYEKQRCDYERCNKKISWSNKYYCKYCKKFYCEKHRLPENHNCKNPKLPLDMKKGFGTKSDSNPRSYV